MPVRSQPIRAFLRAGSGYILRVEIEGSALMKSVLAGFVGGVLAVGVLAAVAVRLMPELMPRMMERMMASGDCSERMRECMEKCGCAPASKSEE
jgi:hypothetical protein